MADGEWYINFSGTDPNYKNWFIDAKVASRNMWEPKLEKSGQVVRVIAHSETMKRESQLYAQLARNCEATIHILKVLEIAKKALEYYANSTQIGLISDGKDQPALVGAKRDIAIEALKLL